MSSNNYPTISQRFWLTIFLDLLPFRTRNDIACDAGHPCIDDVLQCIRRACVVAFGKHAKSSVWLIAEAIGVFSLRHPFEGPEL